MLKICILDGCQEHEFMSVLEAKIKPLFIYIQKLKYVVLSLDNMKNKRGVFFTALVILILSLFFVSFTFFSTFGDRKEIRARVNSMNNFVFSLEKDMSRQVYISSFRAILSLGNEISNTGEFVTDPETGNIKSSETLIEEALTSGTLNGVSYPLMDGYKLSDWETKVSELGEKVNVQVDYTIQDVEVTQDSPWMVKVKMTIDILIEDKSGLASWQKTEEIVAEVEITEFEDPLYLVHSNGKVPNKIIKSSFCDSDGLNCDFVDGSDITKLIHHSENSNYTASPTAPSFLDRLQGKLDANKQAGIESLVNLKEFSDQGISTSDKSVVDYIYFSTSEPTPKACKVLPAGTPPWPSWFKLDNEHLATYEVTWDTSNCNTPS